MVHESMRFGTVAGNTDLNLEAPLYDSDHDYWLMYGNVQTQPPPRGQRPPRQQNRALEIALPSRQRPARPSDQDVEGNTSNDEGTQPSAAHDPWRLVACMGLVVLVLFLHGL
eukprot:TRINITY_DN52039_c0_g1_i1.p1 TRINITY_DN52039_c0_g1~~TRINITY_DN52039_c0_g1_i1.p1  ORF type:complete len:112 (+),score=9.58 TRINITY_DN52039_c0_g1_i1:75-410(+)